MSQPGHAYFVGYLLHNSQLEDIGVLHFGHFGTIGHPLPVISRIDNRFLAHGILGCLRTSVGICEPWRWWGGAIGWSQGCRQAEGSVATEAQRLLLCAVPAWGGEADLPRMTRPLFYGRITRGEIPPDELSSGDNYGMGAYVNELPLDGVTPKN